MAFLSRQERYTLAPLAVIHKSLASWNTYLIQCVILGLGTERPGLLVTFRHRSHEVSFRTRLMMFGLGTNLLGLAWEPSSVA